MKNTKILFITNHLNGNDGWSRYSLDIIKELKKEGCEILVLVFKKSNLEDVTERVVLGEPLEYLFNPFKFFLLSRKVNKVIEDFDPDIIHFLVEPYANIIPFIKSQAKIFLTIHGTYSFIPKLLNNEVKKIISIFWQKMIYNRVDGIISVSDFTKNYLLNNLDKKNKNRIEKKIKVIFNGIDFDYFNKMGIIKNSVTEKKKILFVGAIKSRKGISEAINAINFYKNNFSSNFVYDIVGKFNIEDEYYKNLVKKIKDYKLEDKVFFKGQISEGELVDYYRNADMFLLLSKNNGREFEGFGLVYLEANAFGVPCVGANKCGAEDAIINGKTGYIENLGDYKKIAEKIDLILNKKKINRDDCLQWAKKNDITLKVRELIDFYV